MANVTISGIASSAVTVYAGDLLEIEQSSTSKNATTGLLRSTGWVRLTSDYTLTSTTTAQKLFNATTNGALNLAEGVYFFEALLYLLSMSATSGNGQFRVLGGGTATLGTVLYHGVGIDANTPTTAASQTGTFNAASSSAASIVTAGTGTGMGALINGTFTVTAAGTIIPSIALVTAAAALVKAGSYFKCLQVSPTAANTVGGDWS